MKYASNEFSYGGKMVSIVLAAFFVDFYIS